MSHISYICHNLFFLNGTNAIEKCIIIPRNLSLDHHTEFKKYVVAVGNCLFQGHHINLPHFIETLGVLKS